ncbi:antibiotic biosynthesis monooxygenase family protein [Salinisphaera orenii]|uniref:antibiotic biosynthesis monooxygenase family protein n=1 Tax=Salinisphaera orenii TaxID=856731 RepID=UPI000DBE0C21
MFIAMNRFKIHPGYEAEFERVWLERESHLQNVEGFVEFHLLQGPSSDDNTLYASHTVWASREAFEAWTRSEAFRAAHRNAGANSHIYVEGPRFEGFDVVQRMGPTSSGTERM